MQIAPRDDILRPLYRRVLIVLALAAWSAFEAYNQTGIWGTIFVACTVYATWDFFLRGKYADPPPDDEPPPADD